MNMNTTSRKSLAFTAAAMAAAAASAAGLPKDRFNIGTYCVAAYAQTESHIRDMKECGIDFVIGLRGDKARPLLAKYGIMEIVGGYIPHPPGSPKAGTWEKTGKLEAFDKGCERFLADYKAGKYPTFAALSLGDEPNAVDFPHLAKTVARTQAGVHGLPLYLNLFPSYATTTNATAKYPHAQLGAPSYREYIDAYCRYVPIDHICWDFYMYGPSSKAYLPRFYENFTAVADACRRTGRTLRFVGQVNSARTNFWVSANMLRFQGFATMAFGGESISWACWSAGWWSNFVVDRDGRRTQQYDKLKKVNAELRPLRRNTCASATRPRISSDSLPGAWTCPRRRARSRSTRWTMDSCAISARRTATGWWSAEWRRGRTAAVNAPISFSRRTTRTTKPRSAVWSRSSWLKASRHGSWGEKGRCPLA